MERDDSYYDIYYYTDDRIDHQSKEEDVRFRGQMDDVSNFENPRTPRALGSLEEVVRKRTPTWICRVLKTHIRDDVALEDLFANCWLLGRVAEALLGILDRGQEESVRKSPLQGGGESSPQLRSPLSTTNASFSLGERPYKAMTYDFDIFMDLCDRLGIREESRFTLSEVEQKADGERIGMCLWDICNALHDKSMTGELPEYVGRIVPKFTDPPVSSPSPQMSKGKMAYLTPTSQKTRFRFSTQGGDGPEDTSDHEDSDGSTRVLTSILTSSVSKSRHAKLLDAVMMTDFCDEEEDAHVKSPLPKIVDSFGSRVHLDHVVEKEEKTVPTVRERSKKMPEKECEQRGLPGLILLGVSMAAGFLLSSFLSSRRHTSKRRYRDSQYTMEGRW